MSRKAKRAILVPAGVEIVVSDHMLRVKGQKGDLTLDIHPDVEVRYDAGKRELRVEQGVETLSHKGLVGLFWSLVNNMVFGVTEGFRKSLDIKGIGYNVKLQGRDLVLQVGFSQPVVMAIPNGLEVELPSNTQIVVRGADKRVVGQFAAEIRKLRAPSPYPHATGIKYTGEEVRKKAGKTFTSGT